MVQPQQPPLSIRLTVDAQAALDAVVQKSGWTRNFAINHLLELGAQGFECLPKFTVKATPTVHVDVPAYGSKTPAPKKLVNRLKGEWKAP